MSTSEPLRNPVSGGRSATGEELERELREALAHLHDPDYQPSEALCALVGCDARNGALAFQSTILRIVEGLEPPPATPDSAHTKRTYDLLYNRFVLGLTQEETAERLHTSLSSIQRAQRGAVHTLARILWAQSRTGGSAVDGRSKRGEIQPVEDTRYRSVSTDWRSQAVHELSSLREAAPGAVAPVGQVLNAAVALAGTLASRYGVDVELGPVQPNLTAAIHPSAFSQLLFSAIRELLNYVSSGQILVVAEQAEGHVEITLTGRPSAARDWSAGESPESSLVREILASYGGDVDITTRPGSVSLVVKLPSVDRCVLVVDDNTDMIHLYRRYVAGTRYRMVHTAQGQRVLEAIEVSAPDVIVLDVMLPDINGWELLGQLRDNPASRSIPIVVCSVVREEELALELGAARHLAKPVQRRRFLQALDQALSQAPAGASRAADCSVAAC